MDERLAIRDELGQITTNQPNIIYNQQPTFRFQNILSIDHLHLITTPIQELTTITK